MLKEIQGVVYGCRRWKDIRDIDDSETGELIETFVKCHQKRRCGLALGHCLDTGPDDKRGAERMVRARSAMRLGKQRAVECVDAIECAENADNCPRHWGMSEVVQYPHISSIWQTLARILSQNPTISVWSMPQAHGAASTFWSCDTRLTTHGAVLGTKDTRPLHPGTALWQFQCVVEADFR